MMSRIRVPKQTNQANLGSRRGRQFGSQEHVISERRDRLIREPSYVYQLCKRLLISFSKTSKDVAPMCLE